MRREYSILVLRIALGYTGNPITMFLELRMDEIFGVVVHDIPAHDIPAA